jgi:hypothetical protein
MMQKIACTTIQNSVTHDVHNPVLNAHFTQVTFMRLCHSCHQCVIKLLKSTYFQNHMIIAINGVS